MGAHCLQPTTAIILPLSDALDLQAEPYARLDPLTSHQHRHGDTVQPHQSVLSSIFDVLSANVFLDQGSNFEFLHMLLGHYGLLELL